jgi:hypothetical protein
MEGPPWCTNILEKGAIFRNYENLPPAEYCGIILKKNEAVKDLVIYTVNAKCKIQIEK